MAAAASQHCAEEETNGGACQPHYRAAISKCRSRGCRANGKGVSCGSLRALKDLVVSTACDDVGVPPKAPPRGATSSRLRLARSAQTSPHARCVPAAVLSSTLRVPAPGPRALRRLPSGPAGAGQPTSTSVPPRTSPSPSSKKPSTRQQHEPACGRGPSCYWCSAILQQCFRLLRLLGQDLHRLSAPGSRTSRGTRSPAMLRD